MATQQRISAELGRMAIAYRQPIDGQNEFPLLVQTWTDLCGDISDAEFSAACMLHMSRSKFFPCPADIISVYEASRPAQSMAALPEPPEDKTPGLGLLVVAAIRGDIAAQEKLGIIRHKCGRNMQ